jgi:hypothetical protein
MDCEIEEKVQRPHEAGMRVPAGAPPLAPLASGAPMEDPQQVARNAFRCLSTTPMVGLLVPSLPMPMPFAPEAPELFKDASNEVEQFETASYASTWDPMEGDLNSPRSSTSSYPWHCFCPNDAPVETGSAYTEQEQPKDEMEFGNVKNTFIHFATTPTAQARSSSVPRSMRLGRSR